jgi:hypothetical protein
MSVTALITMRVVDAGLLAHVRQSLVWCYFADGVISRGFQFIGPLAGSGALKDRHVTPSYASSNNPCEGPFRFRRQISPSADQGLLRRSRNALLERVDRP